MREQYCPCVPTTEARYYKSRATAGLCLFDAVRSDVDGLNFALLAVANFSSKFASPLQAHDAIVNNIFVRAPRSGVVRDKKIRRNPRVRADRSKRLIRACVQCTYAFRRADVCHRESADASSWSQSSCSGSSYS
uniref:Uncharacterized protein n=1 Tax=Trichogramma kaykai TaxID=54128 RepID=A0ABD2WWN5_9HYME